MPAPARLVAPLLALVVGLVGCGDESSERDPRPSDSTATTTAPATVPPTTFPLDQGAALREAVTEYENRQGVEAFRFDVRNLLLSSADPTWARFNVAPTPGNEAVFQGAYGVAHLDGGTWTIVDLGTVDVGCPPTEVPSSVRESLQLGCPG